jgi:hypothetical protein
MKQFIESLKPPENIAPEIELRSPKLVILGISYVIVFTTTALITYYGYTTISSLF